MTSVAAVNFTLRQWAVIVVLAAGFIVAAILVSSSAEPVADEALADFDNIVWCEAANAIRQWSSILDGSADGDSIDDVRNLRRALADGRVVAPLELGFEIARLQDFAMLVEQGDEVEGDLVAGLDSAQNNVDRERVAQAVAALDDALSACGLAGISTG